mgnify:CR=1 FL=1
MGGPTRPARPLPPLPARLEDVHRPQVVERGLELVVVARSLRGRAGAVAAAVLADGLTPSGPR